MADVLSDQVISDVAKLARAGMDVKVIEAAGTAFAVIPSDTKVEDLSKFFHSQFSERPARKQGTVKVTDPESFIEYYERFSDGDSRVFADEDSSKFVAVLDHHEAGEGGPRWGTHRVELTLRPSQEWGIWFGKDGKDMPQMDFAEFLEENAADIVNPNSATMLEVARDMSAKIDVDFGSAVRTDNGQVRFRFSETVKASVGAGQIEVPAQFIIGIPVYVGAQRSQLPALLRYRINSGKLTFRFKLQRPLDVRRAAFLDAGVKIASTLSITVINGVPA